MAGGSSKPGPKCTEETEQLEGMLTAGFVRIRQLLVRGPSSPWDTWVVRELVSIAAAQTLTCHETSLRAEFDPRPYFASVDSRERFFQHLMAAC